MYLDLYALRFCDIFNLLYVLKSSLYVLRVYASVYLKSILYVLRVCASVYLKSLLYVLKFAVCSNIYYLNLLYVFIFFSTLSASLPLSGVG